MRPKRFLRRRAERFLKRPSVRTLIWARRSMRTAQLIWCTTPHGWPRRLRMIAMNPRALKPSEAARLLNSTPLGPVIDERQLYRHRNLAGFRIGDGKHIDLYRYIAWLVETKHAP